MIDYDFTDHGSLVMVTPRNDAAHEHLSLNSDGQWLGNSLAVEPRYASDLSAELCRNGFTVELPDGRVVTDADLLNSERN